MVFKVDFYKFSNFRIREFFLIRVAMRKHIIKVYENENNVNGNHQNLDSNLSISVNLT